MYVSSDLRSEVLRRPTEGLHGGSVSDAFFAEAKVCDLNVSVFVQHQVFQLRQNKTSVNICVGVCSHNVRAAAVE